MLVVDLSETESRIARYVGKLRNTLSLQSKHNQRRDPAQTDEEMNVQGMGAELAAAKYLNVYPDLSPQRGRLPQYDLVYRGQKIDVKWNHLPHGDLLVISLYEDVLYLLVYGAMPHYKMVSYLEGSLVPLKGEYVDLKFGPCWRVHPQYLHPIEKLEVERCDPRQRPGSTAKSVSAAGAPTTAGGAARSSDSSASNR